ncbi:uncharacterized protein AB675_5207 [Cyphellophora attinorum]|uniref:AAA+ ATPase domain-containing protein n=1 Tax=Cyphellophora attinorum TaxID=1664694 RepID=A0A0N1H8E1_9EURO|nr:uncharacterized protein AB675_5207 [Phialophora attinorum]KPI39347.1 hypothetical protein AB675_5207 [Phialophora attinorum]
MSQPFYSSFGGFPSTDGPWRRRRVFGHGAAAHEAENEYYSDSEQTPVDDSISSGSLCQYKPFYARKDKDGKTQWTTKEPEDAAEPVEGRSTAKYAFLVRLRKSSDTRKKYDLDSVVVQSQLLKTQLGVALADYPGVTTSLERLVFSAPFRPFVHRWDHLTTLLEDSEGDDPASAAHLKLFLDLLYTELKEAIDVKTDLVRNGVITFEHLWTICEPETLIFGEQYGQQCVWELKHTSNCNSQDGVPYLSLAVWSVDFDGSRFGKSHGYLDIHYFEGTVKIDELEYFPLDFHTQRNTVARALIARGKSFAALAGYHYKWYTGVALAEGKARRMVRHNVESRIIIDCNAYNGSLPNYSVSVGSLGKETSPFFLEDDADSVESEESFEVVQGAFGRPLTAKEYLLCASFVRGFALRAKLWLWLFVDQIAAIRFNDNAFDSLQLPAHQKRLINALVKTQARCKDNFDDVIAGKGRGMIMLLAGPPGVGKTLTAESVADNLRVPLYVMSAGDLGTDPSAIEVKLTFIMDNVARWNAVLLLDEADVFLEARSVSDLERNKLVSIFLRMLEYYSGILFLTTNRIKNIDDAFHSRIHVTVNYPKLSETSRKHIWEAFLDKHSSVSNNEIDELSKLDMNGRVIKNIMKTALMVARSEQSETDDSPAKLDITHIRTVLAIEQS